MKSVFLPEIESQEAAPREEQPVHAVSWSLDHLPVDSRPTYFTYFDILGELLIFFLVVTAIYKLFISLKH
jgi:hypothetical protein